MIPSSHKRIRGLLAIWHARNLSGSYYLRTSAVVEIDGVRHYLTTSRDDTDEAWPLPATGVDYVNGTDPASVEAELNLHGCRRVGIDWLVGKGFARHVSSTPFNSLTRGQNVIDFQYDHPGILPHGTEMTWEIRCGEYHDTHTCRVG